MEISDRDIDRKFKAVYINMLVISIGMAIGLSVWMIRKTNELKDEIYFPKQGLVIRDENGNDSIVLGADQFGNAAIAIINEHGEKVIVLESLSEVGNSLEINDNDGNPVLKFVVNSDGTGSVIDLSK